MREAYKSVTWLELFAAAARSLSTGLNPLDPFGSLVDLAIEESMAAVG